MGVLFDQEQEPWISVFSEPEEQGRVRLGLLSLALSPEIRSAWEALDWSTPGTRLALGKRPVKWAMPSPPLPQPGQWLGRDKEPRITEDTAAGPLREARTLERLSARRLKEKLRCAWALSASL